MQPTQAVINELQNSDKYLINSGVVSETNNANNLIENNNSMKNSVNKPANERIAPKEAILSQVTNSDYHPTV